MKSKTSFTKKDIIVVLACTIFLMANLGLVSTNGREHAKQMVCATNIRQLLAALTMHANENDGRFPENEGGYWLWDLDIDTCNIIIEHGATKDIFYCPSNRQHKRHREEYWNYSSSYRLTGYFWMLYNPAIAGWTYYEDYNHQITRPFGEKLARRINVKAPAEFELIIDATISDTFNWPRAEYPNGNFERILVGGMGGNPDVSYDTTNHLKSDKEAAGCNVGFVDGHVEWREFKDMMIRLNIIPLHWW